MTLFDAVTAGVWTNFGLKKFVEDSKNLAAVFSKKKSLPKVSLGAKHGKTYPR
jgi:hypothetical protein